MPSGLCSREPAHRLCPLVGASFALAGAFGRLNQVVAVLFAENAALLSILPEEAVPAICRAGSMVADTVHRDGQNFFISKPSFDGFGKFSPKTKKRVPLSVPREQRVNALCMEKSVLHGFGQECGK